MEPVQAFAILSLGAFVTVLVTALFYVFSVRPRLLEPVPLESVGMLDEAIKADLLEPAEKGLARGPGEGPEQVDLFRPRGLADQHDRRGVRLADHRRPAHKRAQSALA